MQTVVMTSDYPDLYRFLAGLSVAYSDQLENAKFNDQKGDKSVLIWSPGTHCNIFDAPEKLEIVEKYARQLGARVTLSAASNAPLREWGSRIGWTVLWSIPDLDRASAPNFSRYAEVKGQSESEIAC